MLRFPGSCWISGSSSVDVFGKTRQSVAVVKSAGDDGDAWMSCSKSVLDRWGGGGGPPLKWAPFTFFFS